VILIIVNYRHCMLCVKRARLMRGRVFYAVENGSLSDVWPSFIAKFVEFHTVMFQVNIVNFHCLCVVVNYYYLFAVDVFR